MVGLHFRLLVGTLGLFQGLSIPELVDRDFQTAYQGQIGILGFVQGS